jgi:tRNA (guanine37-N1)-methyltransferase
MWFGVASLFPTFFTPLMSSGVVGNALQAGLIQLVVESPRDYAPDPQRTVDDRPYGGGPGMVLKAPPLWAAIERLKEAAPVKPLLIYFTPGGAVLDQQLVQELRSYPALLLIAGRYEGIDQRIINSTVDREISIGDYVLSGGELPALVLIDALARWVPGVLGHSGSATQDAFSHQQGGLDHPHYTRPAIWQGQAVPQPLLSGDHKAIARWRKQQALGETWLKRPELLKDKVLSEEEQQLLEAYLWENKYSKY